MGWSLYIAYYHHMKMNYGTGYLAPLILNVSTRCTLVFYFHVWEIAHSTCWVKGCVLLKVWSFWCGEVMNIYFTVWWMKPGFIIIRPIPTAVISIRCALKCWMLSHLIHIWELVWLFWYWSYVSYIYVE